MKELFSLIINIITNQSILTLILVLTTIYYAHQTKRTVKEMSKSRKSEFLPILTVKNSEDFRDETCWNIKITNIGRGVAFLKFVFINGKEAGTLIGECAIYPNEEPVNVSVKNPKRCLHNGDDNILSFVYKDIFGRTMTSNMRCNYTESSKVCSIFYPSLCFYFGKKILKI